MARMKAPLDKPSPDFETLTDNYEGKRYNSPNDACYDKSGNLYFTDPPYGLPGQDEDPTKELPFNGVYRLNTDGTVDLLVDSLTRPNGIALSPDQSTLYVTNDNPAGVGEIHAWDVAADGMLSNGRIFATAAVVMDGMVVDANGTLYATSFASGRNSSGRGVWVFARDGQTLGLIPTPEQPTNCTLADGTLYITASSRVFSIALDVAPADTAVQSTTWPQVKEMGNH